MDADDEASSSLSKQSLTINDLPEEVLVTIFGHVDVFSQNRSRRVCKLWNTLIRLPTVRKNVILDFSVCLTVFHWLYTEDWCKAFMDPNTKKLTMLCGSELDDISDNIIRYFFSEGCRWASHHCPRLREISIIGGKVDSRCFLDLPKSVVRVTLRNVNVNQPIESLIHEHYSVFVKDAVIDMENFEERDANVDKVLDSNAALLSREQQSWLKENIIRLNAECYVAASEIVRRRESKYEGRYQWNHVNFRQVDFSSLRPTTQGILNQLVIYYNE